MAAYRRRFMGSVGAVGVVAGFGAVGLYWALELGSSAILGALAHYHPLSPGHEQPLFTWGTGQPLVPWLLIVLPPLGALLSGLITFTWAPEVEGHGTDAAIQAYHFRNGRVRARVPFLKALTSVLTISSGGSGGREGPIAQIGSGFGSVLSGLLGMPSKLRRTLMATGMGAGISAIFRAPLAGPIFASEVMYRGPYMEHVVLFPGFLAAVIAYCVFGSFFGYEPLFLTPGYNFVDPRLLIPYTLLAVVTALGAILYVSAFYGTQRVAEKWRLPRHVKPAIGGLLTGLLGFVFPESLASGYGTIQAAFNGDRSAGPTVTALPTHARLLSWLGLAPGFSSNLTAAGTFGLIALAKIATTSTSIGTGGSGGVFGPAVVIGGALGGATGHLSRHLFPRLEIEPGAFALVGMASFFAGAANTPISTIVMVGEMTGNYGLIVPAMFASITAYAICRRFTLYERQLDSPYHSPAHFEDMAHSILMNVGAGQALADVGAVEPPKTLPTTASVAEARAVLDAGGDDARGFLAVLDPHGYPLALLGERELSVYAGPEEASLKDSGLLAAPAPLITSEDSLQVVLDTFAAHKASALLVVDKDEFRTLLGVLRPELVLEAYRKWSGAAD